MPDSVKIIATGSFLPRKTLTNDQIAEFVDTSHQWIVDRTGIHSRHLVSEGETVKDISIKAAEDVLKNAGLKASDIDAVFVATCAPNSGFPSVASHVQTELGIRGPGMDIAAACGGFIYTAFTAERWMTHQKWNKVLVIGAETLSSYINWENRGTCVLFGDGAGAVILERQSGDPKQSRGFIDFHIGGSGVDKELLDGDNKNGAEMNGREVFKHAVREMQNSCDTLLSRNHYKAEDIDFVVAHQANQRIIDAIGKQMKLPDDKMISTIATHANTSAASIPLALHASNQKGLFKNGDLIVTAAFGAGFTWGGALLRW